MKILNNKCVYSCKEISEHKLYCNYKKEEIRNEIFDDKIENFKEKIKKYFWIWI